MSFLSVVKIYATYQNADHDSPWQANSPSSGTGSGVLIDESGLILTAAHVIANYTFVQVQKQSSTRKVVAHVVAVNDESDLALLSVDAEFVKDLPAMSVGPLPNLQDKVSVCGFPIGGDEVSITEGVVSRIEIQHYTHSQRYLLAVTVDAAINSGNSGGPVIKDGKIVGIAFQSLEDGENIGEIVPPPLIEHFLSSVAQNASTKIPAFGLVSQLLENKALRTRLGMKDDQSGVLITSVMYGNSSWGTLQAGDVLMKAGGYSIANNGTIRYMGKHRTLFSAVMHDYHVGESLEVEILRDGEVLTKALSLLPIRYLLPRSQYNSNPSYFVFGGLVFQQLTRDFLATWDNWSQKAPSQFVKLYYRGYPTEERQEVVIVSHILADENNVGYEDYTNEIIDAVNGTSVRDLAHLVELVESITEGYVEFRTNYNELLVLDVTSSREANPAILKRYRVTSDRSPDLEQDSQPN
jgi:S1-C subfamily serine protease